MTGSHRGWSPRCAATRCRRHAARSPHPRRRRPPRFGRRARRSRPRRPWARPSPSGTLVRASPDAGRSPAAARTIQAGRHRPRPGCGRPGTPAPRPGRRRCRRRTSCRHGRTIPTVQGSAAGRGSRRTPSPGAGTRRTARGASRSPARRPARERRRSARRRRTTTPRVRVRPRDEPQRRPGSTPPARRRRGRAGAGSTRPPRCGRRRGPRRDAPSPWERLRRAAAACRVRMPADETRARPDSPRSA